MNWGFTWAGVKRDQRGKNHLYGWIVKPSVEDGNRYFRIHGMISSEKPIIHMFEKYPYYEGASRSYVGGKIKEGYKAYPQSQLEKNFPAVFEEINAYFILERLKK